MKRGARRVSDPAEPGPSKGGYPVEGQPFKGCVCSIHCEGCNDMRGVYAKYTVAGASLGGANILCRVHPFKGWGELTPRAGGTSSKGWVESNHL